MNGSVVRSFRAEEAYALSAEAGWNQTAGDWERLARLAPDGCFGIRLDGVLISTAVALVHDTRLAWIGMVLTAKAHRGMGYAGKLLRLALDWLDASGIGCTKLDATDLGRPVYAKLGFVDERPVSRWTREPAAFGAPPSFAAPPALIADPFGADRSALLAELHAVEHYTAPDGGFAFGRPGRQAAHFGPCVAKNKADAECLLRRFLASHGNESSMLDLFDEHTAAVELAADFGYQPSRRLSRMYRGMPGSRDLAWHPDIYNLAAFEYG